MVQWRGPQLLTGRSIPKAAGDSRGLQAQESCWERGSLPDVPQSSQQRAGILPSLRVGWLRTPRVPRLELDGKRPGGRGEQGLRRPRCRIAAPSGLLMGLAEPRCLRPGPADLPQGGSPGARRRDLASPAQPSWGAAAPPTPRSPAARA